MKKIGLVILMIVLLATVANAASINGEFEGNPIIKMKSNGKTLVVEDVPAILYKGRTMIPIGMLRDLGVGVTWDQKTASVDVIIPTTPIYNKQYIAYSKKYKSLINDIEFIHKYTYTMEFFYETNLNRKLSKSEEETLLKELDGILGRYNESLADNQKVINDISPLKIDSVYEIQNIMYEATEQYKRAYEKLLGWKYSFDTMIENADPLTKQAAKNVSDKYLSEFDSYASQAVDKIDKSLNLANKKFDISINEIK